MMCVLDMSNVTSDSVCVALIIRKHLFIKMLPHVYPMNQLGKHLLMHHQLTLHHQSLCC